MGPIRRRKEIISLCHVWTDFVAGSVSHSKITEDNVANPRSTLSALRNIPKSCLYVVKLTDNFNDKVFSLK